MWIVRKTKYLTNKQLGSKETLIIEDKALIEYKGDRQPIGLYEGMKPFSQVEITLIKGDLIYLFTDGFADQFGGEKGKKMKYRPFKKTLMQNSNKTMPQQKEILTLEFENWKNKQEQVDDVCVIGIKI